MSALEYLSLGDPAFRTDRFSAYQRLRDHNPVARAEPDGTRAVLTRYADVERIFKDPQMRVQPKAGEFPAYLGTGPGATFHKLSLPDLDAPKHTRLRKLASPAFAPRALGHMRSWVERIITDNIEALAAADGEVDFVEHFGMRVPAEIACRLLHAPAADAETVLRRMPALNRVLTHTPLTPDELAEADEVAQFYFDYIGEIIDSKRGKLGPEDPVGALMLAEEEGGRLSRDELIVTLVGFFIASYHTTMTAMTNAVHALLSHPDQMRLLTADPDLAPAAWEEVLRWQSPVHFITRYAGYEFELHGETIAEGTQLLLGIGSANRDERRFPDPDTFDIRRADKRHLAFTAGGHYCLGAPLSRLEGDILLRLLPQRLPAMALIDTNTPRTDDLVFPVMTALMVAPKGV
ncbi:MULTISPECIES: cytochrome P450 [Streptomyces]|uniref:cytochrome P450 n=1 Tax=Streptomyces TaxID=1883 RepID=UPI001A94E051|nr:MULTISPECIES: cytochrome P450 [Streptomyces]MBO0914029.1 cytochrome P450 [Streptomyces laculatispora]MCX4768141.1 cytochrome P450 [Streptomyces sp. NBC_01285]